MSLLSDFGIGQVNKPIRVVTSLPLTCKKGEIAFVVSNNADLNQIFASFAVNTWTLIFDSSGASNVADPLVIPGIVSSYNGIPVAGLTPIIVSIGAFAQAASITTTPLAVVPAMGMYRVNTYCDVKTRPTTGTITVTIGYNNGDTALTRNIVSAVDVNVTTGAHEASGSGVIFADGINNITYAMTLGSLTGTPSIDIYLSLEAIN